MRSHLIAAIFLVAAFVSCSPKHYPPVQVDSVYTSRIDSVYLRDSIYIDRYTVIHDKGDTIFIQQVKTEYRDRIRIKEVHDTTYLDKTITETIEVEKKLSNWQIVWMQLGKVFAILLGLLLIIFILKKIV